MSPYHGRFAPSPSGRLHFGSLVAATGSYLRARSLNGFWHLRIEDIDTTRCRQEHSDSILRDLELLGFEHDGPVLYQTERLDFYKECLDRLTENHQTYYCNCTRADIRRMGGVYNGHCRNLNLPDAVNHSVRLKNTTYVSEYRDEIRGAVKNPTSDIPDIVLRRRDGLYAYNLVCILDDLDTGITEVVRGSDLLYDTFAQISFIKELKGNVPAYAHLPLAMEDPEHKYSKQNHAAPIDMAHASELLVKAVKFLGQDIPDEFVHEKPADILKYAVSTFSLEKISPDSRIV